MDTPSSFDQAYRTLARALLSRAPGFDRCPPALVEELVAQAGLHRAPARELVVRRGDRIEHLTLVVEGALEARIRLPHDRRHLLSLVLPGMLVGYLSFLDGGDQPHDLVAQRPVVLLRMPEAKIRGMCRTYPELMQAMHGQLAARLRLLYEMLAYAQSFSLRDRLVRQLVVLADMVGVRRGERWALDVQISQADLADLLGAGRQAVNTELQRLQGMGLVQVARARIEVLDLERLRTLIPADMPSQDLRLV